MKLTEIAFFTDNVSRMTDFYRRLFGVEPVASLETMSIFFAAETKIFTGVVRLIYMTQTGIKSN